MKNVLLGPLYNQIFFDPFSNGFDELYVVSGFSSAALTRQLIYELKVNKLGLMIGMAGVFGIPEADHKAYKALMKSFPDRFECYYYLNKPGIQEKVYSWTKGGQPDKGFINSPYFSWSSFTNFHDAILPAVPNETFLLYNHLKDQAVSATDKNIENKINLIKSNEANRNKIAITHGISLDQMNKKIEKTSLSLLTKFGTIHGQSGLNWGQRNGREPNQAYIPISQVLHSCKPGFFPPTGHRFLMEMDDGQVFVGVTAQSGEKALETPENNSLLGIYFRDRIGIPRGEFINKEDLEDYGRTDIGITKIDEDLFLLDFSVNNNPN